MTAQQPQPIYWAESGLMWVRTCRDRLFLPKQFLWLTDCVQNQRAALTSPHVPRWLNGDFRCSMEPRTPSGNRSWALPTWSMSSTWHLSGAHSSAPEFLSHKEESIWRILPVFQVSFRGNLRSKGILNATNLSVEIISAWWLQTERKEMTGTEKQLTM